MSFDLCFHSRSQNQLQAKNVGDYFGRSPFFSAQKDGEVIHFHYNNEETGVYCTFSVPWTRTAGTIDKPVQFRLNYNRPISFPLETFPLVEDFCSRFNLAVEDEQEESTEEANAGRLVDSWRVHNVPAVKALAAAGMKLHYFPESKTLEWWRYSRVRKQIEQALTEDVFVPSVVFVESPEQGLFRMIVFPEAAGQLLPPSDYVWVERNASSNATGREPETGFVRYDELVDRLRHYLDPYEGFGETIKYLSPADALSVVPIVRKLDLQPVDLSTHNGIAPDGFHNVELNQVKNPP